MSGRLLNGVRIPPLQDRILSVLSAQRITTPELIELIYPQNRRPADPKQTLRVHITMLRKRLAAAGFPGSINGVARQGYRLSIPHPLSGAVSACCGAVMPQPFDSSPTAGPS